MQLCFFEDNRHSKFHPLTLTRPVDDLRLGILTLGQKWKAALGSDNCSRILRPGLKHIFTSKTFDPSSPCLWVNPRYIPEEDLLNKIGDMNTGQCLRTGKTVIAALVNGTDSAKWFKHGSTNFSSMFILESENYKSVDNLWDLFLMNGSEIEQDIKRLNPLVSGSADVSDHAVLEDRENIYIQDGATVEAGSVLNAGDGPIYIGPHATIMSGSHIRGPVSIGEKSVVKMGAKIYQGTTLGPVCKAGGEVNNCIFHSYSNKGHDGFTGNSLFGQWCNIGADTNTSNLKNNYSTISISDWDSQKEVETGLQFLGTVMGDHSKTAINTQLNTGTLCGVSCNIFSADFPPTHIQSFSWVGSNVIQTYRLDKAFEAMEAMMARRDVELTEEYKNMMRYIFENRVDNKSH